jgi:hypothetical protein
MTGFGNGLGPGGGGGGTCLLQSQAIMSSYFFLVFFLVLGTRGMRSTFSCTVCM